MISIPKIKAILYYFSLIFIFAAVLADAGTITVTSTIQGSGRDSHITLREAIQLSEGILSTSDLNEDEQALVSGDVGKGISDTINFNISGTGPHVIELISVLPNIKDDGTVINGYTQPGASSNTATDRTAESDAVIMIEIDGSGISGKFSCFSILSSNNVISGLSIHSFTDHGIYISGSSASNNWIWGSYIGTDITGMTAKGNSTDGIIIINGANNNTIGTNGDGTDDVAERNIISGNGAFGVDIFGANCNGNKISGNFIGTDVTGKLNLGNGDSGINIIDGPQNNVIGTDADGAGDENEGNIISGNKRGIFVRGTGTSGSRISGNYIGVDVTGSNSLSNSHVGIFVINGANNNIIGSSSGSEDSNNVRNIISGNGFFGIIINGKGSDSNSVSGNYIGVSADGSKAVGNEFGGIGIIEGPKENLIGSKSGSGGNVISGNNRDGIVISGAGTTGNKIYGNIIGEDPTGTTNLGNKGNGIIIRDSATSNKIEQNKIKYNTGTGIDIFSGGNSLSQNIVSSNEVKNIDVHDSPNDPLPPTEPPSIISAIIDGSGNLRVRGTAENSSDVEVFGYPADESDNISYIGKADASNKGEWSINISTLLLEIDDYVLATADGKNGTSAYSSVFKISNPGLSVNIVAPSTAARGEQIELKLYYSNSTDQKYTDIKISVPLPDEVSFVSASELGSLEEQTVVWEPGNIGADGSGMFTFKVKVSSEVSDGSEIIFSGYSIYSAEGGEVNGNDVVINVSGTAVFSSSFISVQDVNGGIVKKGDTLRYKLHLINSGADDATGLKISTFLPSKFTSYSITDIPEGAVDESFTEQSKPFILISGVDAASGGEVVLTFDMVLNATLKKNSKVSLNFSLSSDDSGISGEIEAPKIKLGTKIPKGSIKIVPSGKVKIMLGAVKKFKAKIKRLNLKRVKWEVVSGDGSIDTNKGIYRAPQRAATPQSVKIKAVSVYDQTIFKTVRIRLMPVKVKISPLKKSKIKPGDSVKISGSVKGAKNKKITWKVNGVKNGDETSGTISNKGVYHMPQSPSFSYVTIRAVSFADPTKSAVKKIYVKGN